MESSEPIEVVLDKIFKKYDGNVPGASVSVLKFGKPVFVKTYGMGSLEGDHVTTATNFRLASVTKAFTAMCVMILKERGKLSYSDSLLELLPEFPAYAKDVKIRQMLQHTSGIRDYEDLTSVDFTGQLVDRDVLEMLVKQESTYFPPGSEYRYSNSAYVILGLIVEKLSGVSFSEFMAREIFKPLDMDGSVLHVNGVTSIKNRAYGYAKEGDGYIFNDQSSASLLLGDGGVYSNIVDLAKWDKSLYSSVLVSSDTLEESYKRGILTTGEKTNYGYGWHIGEYNGLKMLYHGGSTAGFRNLFVRIPLLGFSLIVLTNRNSLDFDFGVTVNEFKDLAGRFLNSIEPIIQS